MNRFLASKVDEGLLLLRAAVGLMMMVHGWQKLSNFGAIAGQFADPFGLGPSLSLSLAIFAELACSILLLAGLATRFALLPLLITMATAVLYAHGSDPWKQKELAVLYFMIYAALMVTGPGAYSLDHKLWGSRQPADR